MKQAKIVIDAYRLTHDGQEASLDKYYNDGWRVVAMSTEYEKRDKFPRSQTDPKQDTYIIVTLILEKYSLGI